MASVNYNSFWEDLARGAIDMDTDAFKIMLVTSAYAPNKDTDLKRSNVTNEVVGAGYTAGGLATTCTVTKDLATDQIKFSFSGATWPTSTITARAAIIYKSRGGAATADELVTYGDFLADKTSSAGNFVVSETAPIIIQN
jgi:hypothetical protein